MQTLSSQVSYWNSVANDKRFSHPLRDEWIKSHLNAASRIIDYGCGYGRTLIELSRLGYQNVLGLDSSARMLARCRNEVADLELIQSDGQTLPLHTESCDAVLLFAVLTCIPNDDDQRFLIAEIKRVLRPGGLLYISDLLVNADARNRQRYEQDASRFECYGVFELPEGVVVRHHTKQWICELTGDFDSLAYEPFTVSR